MGLVGSPMCAREAVLQNSARGCCGKWGVGLVFLGDLLPTGLGVLDVIVLVGSRAR